jgi:SAM-dependent methyltransferase
MSSPSNYTDEQWLELMIEGLETGLEGVPSGPPPHIQAQFVGWSGEAAMRQCYSFYKVVKRDYDGDLATARLLDFGVGWGRVIRLFAHDVPEPQLFGVDVDPDILQVCADTGVPGVMARVDPGAPLPFEDGTFDLAYAYSVFSHLSEDAARSAFGELARIVRSGGQLTFTTQGMRFLDLCCSLRRKAERAELTGAEATIDAFFEDPFSARKLFRKGKHVYTGIGGGGTGVLTGDFYGWAAIPRKWLRANLGAFKVIAMTDDPTVDEQVIVTLRRR